MGEINVLALRELSASSKEGKTRQIRAILPDIEELITSGISYREIVEELKKQGIEISISHFGVILHFLRKQNKRKNAVPVIKENVDAVVKPRSPSIETDVTRHIDEPITASSVSAKVSSQKATSKSIRAIFNNEIDISKYM